MIQKPLLLFMNGGRVIFIKYIANKVLLASSFEI